MAAPVRKNGLLQVSLAAAVLVAAAGMVVPAAAQTTTPQTLPATTSSGEATFRLTDVRLNGAQALAPEQLQALVQPYRGRQVTMADLHSLAESIQAAYRERGYFLAQALVPVQKVEGGVVEISVVEGRLGQINVAVAPDAPISETRVRAFLSGLRQGEAVNAKTYERLMLLLSDQPGIKVTSGLETGVQPGTVDLSVEVEAARRWRFNVEADNHGIMETGRWRLGGTARLNSPAGVGDNLDLRAMVSDKKLVFGRVGYELPLGSSGLRAGVGLGRVEYQVGGVFAPLDPRGQADIFDVSLNYPFIRQRDHNLFGRLVLESKQLKDNYRAVGLELGKRVDALGVGWSWERRDGWLGGGYFASSGTLYRGRLRIKDAGMRAADQAPGGLHTSGGFSRLTFQASRLQAVTKRHNVYYSVGGQWASKNLDSSEKLALGGANAVRAYPISEALVDQGWIQTLEWRWAATDELTPYLFYDAAHGRQFKRLATPAAGNGISLRGAGIGLAWGKPGSFSVNGTVAWRSGTRRAVTDGGGHHPRFFIQAQKVF